jgi:acetyltransferase-like isoleucine patch superfamily enzyme
LGGFGVTDEDFRKSLKALHENTDETLRQDFDRSLSFQDGMFDRWERAKRLGFGKDASIYNSSLVYGDVAIGEGAWIGPYTLLDGSQGGVVIGHHCSISAGVQIYTHDTVLWSLSGGTAAKRVGAVAIGDCTYLGSQAIVGCGVTIGSQCVIAAGSFVNRDVPDRTIVGGTPAKPIGTVEVAADGGITLRYD